MKLTFLDGKFIAVCSFKERAIPRDNKFRWDEPKAQWFTTDLKVAGSLFEYADDSAKAQLSKTRLVKTQQALPLIIPKGETLEWYQSEDAQFALERNRSYLALDPGLGKTPVAAVIAQTLNSKEPWAVIYVCPAFLTINTEEEFRRWTKLQIARAEKWDLDADEYEDVLIVPDSRLINPKFQNIIRDFISYQRTMMKKKILFIVDEAHRFKNPNTGRTKAILELADLGRVDKMIWMSGTPMLNRPMELWPILNHSAPETIDFMNRFKFGLKYCAGHENNFGWDFSGASNIDLLNQKVIETFMRRRRKDALPLPPKTEELVLIGDDLTPKLADMEKKILAAFSPVDLMKQKLSLNLQDDETLHLATYRRLLGNAKTKAAVEYIKYLLDDTDESILVFAIHKETIATLAEALKDFEPIVVTGDVTDMNERHARVKDFQSNPKKRIFLGNIQAAGIGLTLTKASRVVFVEFSWVPGENDQAGDRAHRRGQTKNVLVQYLVYRNSIDRAVMTTVLDKKRTTEKFGRKPFENIQG